MTTAISRTRTDPLPDSMTLYLDALGDHSLLTAEEEIALAQAMEAGRDASSRLDAGDFEDPGEAARLRRVVRRGTEAKERFIAGNLRLVVANARKYFGGSGLDMGDLVQEGNLGLIRAVEKFDWRKGFKFSTYATWWIRQALGRALAEKSRTLRIPGSLHEALGTIRRETVAYRARTGREPTPETIARESGLDLETVERALLVADAVSIEAPIGEDGAELGHFISDGDAPEVGDEVERAEVARVLSAALRVLDERERHIVITRYGFADGVTRTLEEIGDGLGLTPERIRQIEKRAITKLRHPSAGLREHDLT